MGTEKTLIPVMKRRGFNLEKVIEDENGSSFIFVNETEIKKYYEHVIVLEVFAGGEYHLYYTQSGMLGYMDSGMLDEIMNDEKFDYNYLLFHNQVSLLRGNTL